MTSRVAFPIVVSLALAGCPGTELPPASDGGSDAPVRVCDAHAAFVHGGDGATDPLGAVAGEARAGRLTAAMLPTSSTGLAVWAAGDFVLANDRVALLVEDVGASDLYDPFGGRPVGVALVEGGALAAAGDFNEVLIGLSTFLVETETVSVLSDGSDGGPAVVRTTGPLGPIAFAGNLLTAFMDRGDVFGGWQAALDYSLAPDAEEIVVTLTVQSPDGRDREASNLNLAVFQHSRMPTFAPGGGGYEDASGALPFVAFDDPHGNAGWGWRAPAGRHVSPILEISGVNIDQLGSAALPACEETEIALGSVVIGRGAAGVAAAVARVEGTSLRTLSGTVTEADGTTPAGDARVHVSVGGTYWGRTAVADDGTFTIEIPADGTATASAFRRGFPVVDGAVPAGASPVADLALPAFGSIHVTATEAGTPIPVRVQVLPPTGDPVLPPPVMGERPVTRGREHVEFAITGDATLRVRPGTWDVVVSHGYEYELERSSVTVAAGATVDVTAVMRHSVDTTGVMCADYHIHTTRSPDSDDDGALKVSALVADGLEIAIRSDHEFVWDFDDVITSLGLEPWVLGVTGEELTTFTWGHFGVFPLVSDPSEPSGSAIPWVGRLPPAVFADVRARPELPTLIINHPRSGGGTGGWFEAAGYDPVTGEVARPELWDDGFGVVEVFNDTDFEDNRTGTVRDWFSFLSSGRRVVAVGSSDSHHLYDAPVGYPRTCLALGSDDPRTVDGEDVSDATDAGRAIVSGGIYLEVTGPGGEGPGDDVTGAGDVAMVHVVVRAAEWIDVTRLEVWVDGTRTETIPIAAPTGVDPTVRFDGDVAVPVAASAMGSWAVVHAAGDRNMSELHPGRTPFAVSNAMFFRR